MIDFGASKEDFTKNGFAIIDQVFSCEEIKAILNTIKQADHSRPTFRKTADLFAIRQFVKEVPQVLPFIFTERFQYLINAFFGKSYFVVKSIYFDKPGDSNWFVSYHQDLTISVDKKVDMEGFTSWTIKQNQFAVQPLLHILETNFTVRIHLDDTDERNGALRVIPGSHLKGIYRPETIDWSKESETTCQVQKGGVMFMRPLLLHASSRTVNNKKRRIIHIEFSNNILPAPLQWSELVD